MSAAYTHAQVTQEISTINQAIANANSEDSLAADRGNQYTQEAASLNNQAQAYANSCD